MRPAARRLLAAFALAFPSLALADLPNACLLVTEADLVGISERKVEKTRLQKAGNPSECVFLDSRGGAMLTITLKEVKYAVKDEFEVERSNLEKIYRTKAKPIETVGDGAFWLAANKSLHFRKGKVIGSVAFQTSKNQTEIDTSTVARVVESRIK